MKIEINKYTCSACGCSFDAPSLGENAYGEFLLWSREGELAYLNAFEDSTYKEVDNLLLAHPKTSSLPALERARTLRRIYGVVACDLGDKNAPFEIGVSPPCPVCGSQQMGSREPKDPSEVVEIAVRPVTHVRWSSLSYPEKLRLLESQLGA